VSRIDELTAELCPDGVEHRPLAEVGTIQRGRRFVKSDIVESGAPCIHYGEIYTKYGTWATEAFSYLQPELARKLRSALPGDVIIVSAGETIEDIGKAVAWLGEEPVVIHDACYGFGSPLDPKYVAYFLQTADFRTQLRPLVSSSKISSVAPANLGKVRIPVPPLEVQREIVRVLDTFTELEAELEARRRQYAHYRDSLLTFPEGRVRWIPMGEVGEFIRGRRFVKSDVVDDGVPAIHYGEIYTRYGTTARSIAIHLRPELATTLRYAEPGDVVIVDVGETVEDVGKCVAWLGETKVAIHVCSSTEKLTTVMAQKLTTSSLSLTLVS
jgi:type I restriction enzyme S subunit